jgi:ankyrin repeat protein
MRIMNISSMHDSALTRLIRAIVAGDRHEVGRLIAATPNLACAQLAQGATRQAGTAHYLAEIGQHLYAGTTALHVAAGGYRHEIARDLLAAGANMRAKNRRGAEPLHLAAMGVPGSSAWNPPAQAATIACLIEAGADPNAVDKGGVTPLHRAVRTRCAAAVEALLRAGADPRRCNKNGSLPITLATRNTGRGGSGTPEAKAEQREIVRLLEEHGAAAP